MLPASPVAHRLSTIRNADKIYVLQNGRLIQQGNFDQLAQQPGLFSQLIRGTKNYKIKYIHLICHMVYI